MAAEDQPTDRWVRDAVRLVVVALVSAMLVGFSVIFLFWAMPEDDWDMLHLPSSLEEAKSIGHILLRYQESHFWRTLTAFALIFLYLQSFAIPGTTICNLLAGVVFGLKIGFVAAICLSTLGALMLYYISQSFMLTFVNHFFPKRLRQFRQWVKEDEDHLIARIIGIRVFPFTPNWFVNIACGQLHVPLHRYIPATFIGLAPYTFLGCQAGTILPKLSSTRDIMQPDVMYGLMALAVVGILLPTALKRLYGTKTR